jgi:hypothetical protein
VEDKFRVIIRNVKKVRINLKRGCKKWSFPIFDSAESAYYLKDDLFPEEVEECCKVVDLNPGEILEIEWMGFEAVYDDEVKESSLQTKLKMDHERFESVRIAKMTQIKTKSYKTGYVETFSGWIKPGIFTYNASDRNDVRIIQIKGKMTSKMDFSELFQTKLDESKDQISDKLMN